MFKIDDFFKILKYLHIEDGSNLEENTKILALSEKITSSNLFTSKFDMNAFMSNDYKMVKSFLIDWYTSHKTILATQRKANDVFSLPKVHLNELLTSFGYNIELNNITRLNEANLMLDLVNLYKIKGTPKSFANILAYFGMNRLDVSEYYLQKDSNGKLIFRPVICIQNNPTGISVTPSDLDFEIVSSFDPHWMIEKNEILTLFNNGDIVFPIKSPYLGLRPLYYIDKELVLICSILSKVCKDEYDLYKSGGTLPNIEVDVSVVRTTSSLLELYLICDWMIKLYDTSGDEPNYIALEPPVLTTEDESIIVCEHEFIPDSMKQSDRFFRYLGEYDINDQIHKIIEEYDFYIEKRPLSRLDRINKFNNFQTTFTDTFNRCYLKTFYASRDLLAEINPTLFNLINVMVITGKKSEVLISSMKDLSDWITLNMGGDYSNFSTFGLGADALEFVKNIVNFFKPYRARLLTLDSGYIVKNKFMDSITIEDHLLGPNYEFEFIDFDTGNSIPGFKDEDYNTDRCIYSKPPDIESKRINNLYVDSFGRVKCIYSDVEIPNVSEFITSTPPIGQHRIINITLTFDGDVPSLHVIYEKNAVMQAGVSTFISSNPVVGFMVLGIHFNELSQCVIEYDSTFEYGTMSERNYYSRSHMDQGSLFDIGASVDFDTGKCEMVDPETGNFNTHVYPTKIRIKDIIHDRYNYHPPDSNLYTYYETDNYTDNEIRTNGGFVNFDEGWVFDSPFNADVCQIYVYDADLQ